MAVNDINLGTSPTGAGGDSVRAAFEKTNANFQAMLDQLDQRAAAQLEREKRFSRLVESLHGGLPALRADLRGQSYAMKESGVLMPVEYPDLFSLTRPGPTTVWDANGNLVPVPSGEPAFDHGPVTGEPLGQQIWSVGPVTNYVRFSDDATGWGAPLGMTVEPGVPGNPEVVLGRPMDRLTISDQNQSHDIPIPASSYDQSPARYRVYVKSDGIQVIGFGRSARDGADCVVFDIQNAVVLVPDGSDYKNGTIEQLPNGICILEFDNATSPFAALTPRLYMLDPAGSNWDGANAPWQGDGVSGLFIGGFGLFDVSAPGMPAPVPYIPTNGTAATRPADVLSILNLQAASFWGATDAITLVAEFTPGKLSSGARYVGSSAGALGRIIGTKGNGPQDLIVYDGSGSIGSNDNFESRRRIKVAVSFNETHMAFATNEGSVTYGEGNHNGSFLTSEYLEIFRSGISGHLHRLTIDKKFTIGADLEALAQ